MIVCNVFLWWTSSSDLHPANKIQLEWKLELLPSEYMRSFIQLCFNDSIEILFFGCFRLVFWIIKWIAWCILWEKPVTWHGKYPRVFWTWLNSWVCFFPKWKHSQWSTVNLQPDVAWWIHSEMQSLVPNYDSPAPLWRLQHADLAWGTSWPRGSPWTAWAQRNGHALWISHRRCKATTSQKDNSMSRSPWRSLITV